MHKNLRWFCTVVLLTGFMATGPGVGVGQSISGRIIDADTAAGLPSAVQPHYIHLELRIFDAFCPCYFFVSSTDCFTGEGCADQNGDFIFNNLQGEGEYLLSIRTDDGSYIHRRLEVLFDGVMETDLGDVPLTPSPVTFEIFSPPAFPLEGGRVAIPYRVNNTSDQEQPVCIHGRAEFEPDEGLPIVIPFKYEGRQGNQTRCQRVKLLPNSSMDLVQQIYAPSGVFRNGMCATSVSLSASEPGDMTNVLGQRRQCLN